MDSSKKKIIKKYFWWIFLVMWLVEVMVVGVYVCFFCFFVFFSITSGLTRFLPPSFPLLSLGVIITGRPAGMQLHVDLPLFACQFIVFRLFLAAESVPLCTMEGLTDHKRRRSRPTKTVEGRTQRQFWNFFSFFFKNFVVFSWTLF